MPPIRAAGKKKCTNYFVLHCYTNYGVPTGNLDSQNEKNIVELLGRLAHEEDYAVIIVTHSEKIAMSADVVYGMLDGKLEVIRGVEVVRE